MTGLRTSEGIMVDEALQFGEDKVKQIIKNSELKEVAPHLIKKGGHWIIKPESLFLSDGIIACLMIEGNET